MAGAGAFGSTFGVGRGRADDNGDGPPEGHIVGVDPERADVAKDEATEVRRVLDFGEIGQAISGNFSEEALDRLENNPNVRYIEENGQMEALGETVPYGIEITEADTAIDEGLTGDSVSVAILDTGIDAEHETLEQNLGEGWAAEEAECDEEQEPGFFCPTNETDTCYEDWDDDNRHGSHVAGTAAAVMNDTGVMGVAPDATLHSVKVLDACGSGSFDDIAAGIEWSTDQDHDVINMSLGSEDETEESDVVSDAVEYAAANNVVLVGAAGNEGPCEDCVGFPARHAEVIAVSATNEDDELAEFSSTGPEIDIAAPGEDVYSTIPRDDYDELSGTSMATPHVAGAAASVIAAGVTDREEVRSRLTEYADSIGLGEEEQGSGRLNVYQALDEGDLQISIDIETQQADNVHETGADLNGELVAFEGTDEVEVSFRFGEEGSDLLSGTTWEEYTSPTDFTRTLMGLDSGTTYEFFAVGRTDGVRENGEILSFQTTEEDPTIVVETNAATNVSDTEATLQGELAELDEDIDEVEVWFEYGPEDEELPEVTEPETVTKKTSFSADIDGLVPETEYEFQAVSAGDDVEETGEILTFETTEEDEFEIAVETGDATDVGATTATVNGELTKAEEVDSVTVYFEVRTDGMEDWEETEAQELEDTGKFEKTLEALDDETVYEFRAVAEVEGAEDIGEIEQFETEIERVLTVETDEASDVDDESAALEGELTELEGLDEASVFFDWRQADEDEWTESASMDLETTDTFAEEISDLDGDTAYEFRAIAEAEDKRSEGGIEEFETLVPAESVLSNLDIAGSGTGATITKGEDEPIEVDVENVGEVEGEFLVNLEIDDNVVETEPVSLGEGELRSVTFDGITDDLGAGVYNIAVSTEDDTISGELTVEDAFFAINSFNWRPGRPKAGDEFVAMVVIENTGTDTAMRTVKYSFDGSVIGRERVRIAGESTERVEFEHSEDNPGEYQHRVDTENDEADDLIEIREDPGGGSGRSSGR